MTIDITAQIERIWSMMADFKSYADRNSYRVRIDDAAFSGLVITAPRRSIPGTCPVISPVDVVSTARFTTRWSNGLPDRTALTSDGLFELKRGAEAIVFDQRESFSRGRTAVILAAHRRGIERNFNVLNAAFKV